ncbi:GntR family transcriptional regulator [Prauserella cavernicola]|uniref:GntR family transcriptional regulator n=1 Tax=Prauserella cavernicola TaxID=2800127 RepID=A0A934QYL0_9PSEU|nr:GntR family transcriptional regulator [Prauserella cavernicola]MBK1789135.1 GntR family transcriptional regulator [Prauserella cavernicola]
MSSERTQASPATSVPLVEELAAVIRERIYTQRYATGSWLRQEQLSAELGVSRTPLREALRILDREGLIQVHPSQGARVITGDLPTLLKAYELRAVIDGLAARLVAERNDPASGRLLGRAIEAQLGTLDPWEPREYTQSNVDFHEHVLHLSENEFLVKQSAIIRLTAQVFAPVALVGPDAARRAIGEHRAVVDAIDAGDGPAAERLARAHIEATITQLRSREDAAPPAE